MPYCFVRMAIPRLYTVREVAEISRAPVSTVAYWIAQGRLRSKKVGRRQLVTERDLAKFLGLEPDTMARPQGTRR